MRSRISTYLLTGLLRRGALVVLSRGRARVGGSIGKYIVQYCYPHTRKSSNRLLIKNVMDLTLHMILFHINYVVISTSPHLASKGHVQIAVECINPMVFNWLVCRPSNEHERAAYKMQNGTTETVRIW